MPGLLHGQLAYQADAVSTRPSDVCIRTCTPRRGEVGGCFLSRDFEFVAGRCRYKPQNHQLETKLKPFIPDYIPAVGDIDEFIKVRCCPRRLVV